MRVTISSTLPRGTSFVETIRATHRPDMFAYVMADDCPWLSRLTIRDWHGLVSKYHDRHAASVSLISYRDSDMTFGGDA